MSGLKKHKFASVKVIQPPTETSVEGAHAAAVVALNPRGAPITLPLPPCLLDEASVGSKVVVVLLNEVKTPLLSTPNGFRELASDDAAWRLPLGARVQRTADGFVSTQLDPAQDRPDLITATAREAISLFVKHFHDQRD